MLPPLMLTTITHTTWTHIRIHTHTGSRTLYVGLGSDTAPIGVAHCLAYWQQEDAQQPTGSAATSHQPPAATTPDANSYYSGKSAGAAALSEAARFLQLQLPPVGTKAPAAPTVAEREEPEGHDGFKGWVDTAAPEPAPFVPLLLQQGVDEQAEGTEHHHHQQQQQQQQQSQEVGKQEGHQGSKPSRRPRSKGRIVGDEVRFDPRARGGPGRRIAAKLRPTPQNTPPPNNTHHHRFCASLPAHPTASTGRCQGATSPVWNLSSQPPRSPQIT